jgi:hypothetical protein
MRAIFRRKAWAAVLALGFGSYLLWLLYIIGGEFEITLPSDHSTIGLADGARDKPLEFRRTKLPIVEIPDHDGSWMRDLVGLPDPHHPNVSHVLHLLRLYGSEFRLSAGKIESPQPLLSAIVDENVGSRFFGRAALVRTRDGVRFPTDKRNASAELHRDQTLATLGELSVPLSTNLTVSGEVFTLRSVLADSIANFHLSQRELAWTAVAYALYLPPVREWENRYGERSSFDALVDRLLDEPLGHASCGGSHVLFALTTILRADLAFPILSESTNRKLRIFLRRCDSEIARSQQPDGSWLISWTQGLAEQNGEPARSVPDTPESRLLVTSHLAELLLTTPESFRSDQLILIRSQQWLARRLQSMTRDEINRQFCPVVHAVIAIKRAASVTKESRPIESSGVAPKRESILELPCVALIFRKPTPHRRYYDVL